MLFSKDRWYLSWLKKKKKSKPTLFLYSLLKKKISDKRSLSTFNMEGSRMIYATRPKFGKRLPNSFTIRTLFHRLFDGLFLRCLREEEAKQVLEEAHSGICDTHQLGLKLHYKFKRMGYYWPMMVQDSMEYAKKCKACQCHTNFIHQPLEPLHLTIAS